MQCGANAEAAHFFRAVAGRTGGVRLALAALPAVSAMLFAVVAREAPFTAGGLLEGYRAELASGGRMTDEMESAFGALQAPEEAAAVTLQPLFFRLGLDSRSRAPRLPRRACNLSHSPTPRPLPVCRKRT